MRVAIIGCGITGMSAGIILQKAGIDTVIFEKTDKPGGVISVYKKGDMLINNALEFVYGFAQHTFANDMWQSLGMFTKSPEIKTCFNTFSWDGHSVSVYKDFDKTVNELIAISPQDKKAVLRLRKSIKKFQNIELPLITKASDNIFGRLLRQIMNCFTVIPDVLYYGTKKCNRYEKKLKGCDLKKFFSEILNSDRSLLQYIVLWSFISSGNFNVPDGNQKGMVDTLYNNYVKSGGKVQFCSSLNDVTIKNKNIFALNFSDNTVNDFDYVIFSNDIASVTAIMNNSDNRLTLLERIAKKEHVTSSCMLYFKLGCADSCSVVDNLSIRCAPIKVGSRYVNNFSVRVQQNTDTDVTGISVTLYQNETDFLEWKKIINSGIEEYNREKRRIAQSIIIAIEEYFTEIRGKLQLCDMVTPLTYYRYTGVNYGGWMPESWNPLIYLFFGRGHMPGIKNASIAGQKVFPLGGTTIGAYSGIKLAERIIKLADKKHK